MPNEAPPLPAENCDNMADVRAGVDAVDTALVELLARRFAYMDAAARIKTERTAVRDEARKRQVLENVEAAASRLGISATLIQQLWELLVEASITHEQDRWDDLRS